eukprot:TRINITY_DN13823_c0_g1_i1.p1 TRINITY_DN13823_c0_g1~~TRINITY_DN13823_c0_g1_i1.p1  ORF type:complete len:188 (-),score=2.01 TRINITY_DN13823_c0_g1_i1:57-620(-)
MSLEATRQTSLTVRFEMFKGDYDHPNLPFSTDLPIQLAGRLTQAEWEDLVGVVNAWHRGITENNRNSVSLGRNLLILAPFTCFISCCFMKQCFKKIQDRREQIVHDRDVGLLERSARYAGRGIHVKWGDGDHPFFPALEVTFRSLDGSRVMIPGEIWLMPMKEDDGEKWKRRIIKVEGTGLGTSLRG